MKKNIEKVFLFFVIFLIKNCEGKQLDELDKSISIFRTMDEKEKKYN